MKFGILIFAIIAATFAEEKPGNCPAELLEVNNTFVNVEIQQTCVSDFDCNGTEKCCGQMCVPPECDADVAPAQCFVHPCKFATCSSIPEAVCFQDPCSETCEVFWLSEERDVTDNCFDDDVDEDEEWYEIDDDDEDDEWYEIEDDDEEEFVDDNDDDEDDDDAKALTREEKMARRKARKQAFRNRMAEKTAKKMISVEDRRAGKIKKWDKKGKQDKIERFQQKWAKKDATLQDRIKAFKAKKLAERQERKQAKRQRKQQKKEMSPEELEAFKAQRKENRQAKNEAKLERKQDKEEQLMERKNTHKEQKIEKKRARMERKQRRKMMIERE